MRRLSGTLATALAMGIGFLTTISLLLDGTGLLVEVLSLAGLDGAVRGFLPAVLQLVTITAAFTIFIGLFNLIGVHLSRTVRIRQYRLDSLWSLLLVVSAIGVIFIIVLERNGTLAAPAGSPAYSDLLRENVQFTVEASLAGLLAFSLVFGALRLMRRKVTAMNAIFLGALVLSLLIRAGLNFPPGFLNVQQTIVDAGADGILLGVALATVVAGIRVLIGQNRSYRE